MASRAIWKGHLALGDIRIGLALHAAASTSERVTFHLLNRSTGHRLKREFVDSETGKPVEDEDEAKGYEVADDDFIVIDPEKVAEAVPENDHLLHFESAVPLAKVNRLAFDRPYFLKPAEEADEDAYAVLAEALEKSGMAIVVQAVMFRRVRHLVVEAFDGGLSATTLNFEHELRSPKQAFETIPEITIKDEMLDLATHIIDTKAGRFDPSSFDDRYDAALADMVKAKMEGRKIKRPKPPEKGKVIDLMEALRASVDGDGGGRKGGKTAGRKAPAKKKTAAKRKTTAHQKKAS